MININTDKDFLLALDKYPNKLIHARVTALNLQEQPLQSIEGHVTQGSVNVDGASAVRRTCSLTLVADYNRFSQDEAQKFFDYSWGLHTRFKLEIGVENEINSDYPAIIWFPQGIYITTSINVSYSTNSFQLTLQGKDKMCLLNGEVSGSLESSIDFGTEDNMGTKVKVPIEKIILNAVHVYGKEPYHNIIINDLQGYGLELLEYRANAPLYLLRVGEDTGDDFINLTYHGDTKCSFYIKDENGQQTIVNTDLEHLETEGKGQYNVINGILLDLDLNPSEVFFNNNNNERYKIVRIQDGNAAGYRQTELVYAGDLIANIGESLTSILDKIVKMLGYFEYFYDLDGRFVFQKKTQELSEVWGRGLNAGQKDDTFIMPYMLSSNISYSFTNSELVTAFTNAPNISNIRNDFSIWGERTTATGATVPIHMRYAIDDKPVQYVSIAVEENNKDVIDYNNKYNTKLKGQYSISYESTTSSYSTNGDNPYINTQDNSQKITSVKCDWREVIYQMASDYYRYGHLSDFLARVAKANPQLYPTGNTGYEQYYIDINGFWRDLYCPQETFWIDCWQQKELKAIAEDDIKIAIYEKKIAELQEEYDEYLEQENYFLTDNIFTEDINGWSKSVVYTPELLNFWFDFLDLEQGAELEKYSIKSIGHRPKVLNDTNLHSIYYPTVPTIIYLEDIREKPLVEDVVKSSDYSYLQVPDQDKIFSISAQGLSIKDKLNILINEHTHYTESVTITTIPIYYLEPNTRISVVDEVTGINGEYLVSKITVPLQYNGTMQITATKAVNNII